MKSPRNVSAARSSSSVSRMSGEIGQHVLLGHALRQGRDVGVVDDGHPVDLALDEELGHAVRDRLRVLVRGPVGEAHVRARELAATEEERRAALLADGDPPHLLAFRLQRALERERTPEDLRVEGAREAAVSGQRDDRDRLDALPLLEEREADRGRRPPHSGDELVHRLGVRPERADPLLGAPQLRRGHELHRARDLARVADRLDSALEVLNRGHAIASRRAPSLPRC